MIMINIRQNLHDQRTDPTKHPLIKQINLWEEDSIQKIKQTAEQCRERLMNYFNIFFLGKEKQLNDLAEQIKEMRHENRI